jgi:hypothetical protein
MPTRIQYCVPPFMTNVDVSGSEQATCVRTPQLPVKIAVTVSFVDVSLSVAVPVTAGV